MKLKFNLCFLLILFILLFCSTFSLGANVDSFNNWLEVNGKELNSRLAGCDYLIVNNYWENRVALYVTNGANNKWVFEDRNVYGDKSRRNLCCYNDLGNNYYRVYCFNPNNDNNFIMPTTDFKDLSYSVTEGNNSIVNNFSANNILYCSSDIYKDGEVIKKKQPFYTTVLVKATKGVAMEKVVVQMVGLLPLLIPLLISLVALWKAWRLLSRVLYKA